jgi:hypothetical protein
MKAYRYLLTGSVFFALFSGQSAIAQELNYNEVIGKWASDNDVVITAEGKKWVVDSLAKSFKEDAIDAGYTAVDAKKFSEAIADYGMVKAKAGTLVAETASSEIGLAISTPKGVAFANKVVTVEYAIFQITRAPTIKLTVEPVPPRDYVVELNGKLVESTVRGEYKPAPGPTTFRAKRTNKEDCVWGGVLADGQVQPVSCQL